MKTFSTLFLLVFFAASAFGADFYVDSKNGDDNRVGTSVKTAWKTLRRVNGAKLVPGDRVLFRCDGVWDGSLKAMSGSTDKPIVYTSFGRGKKPSFQNTVSLNQPVFWIHVGDNFWATRTEIVRESKTSQTTAGARWDSMQMGGAKGKIDNIVQDGLRGFRVNCVEPGKSFSHREMSLRPLKIESDRKYVFRFKARASIPFVMGEKSVRILRSVAPYEVFCSPETYPGEIKSEWNEYQVVFNNKKTASDARIVVCTGDRVPRNCVFEFLPVSFVEVETETPGLEDGVVNLVFNNKEAGVRKTDRQLLREPGDFFFDGEKSQITLLANRAPWLAYPRLDAVKPCLAVIELSGQGNVVLDGLDVRYSGGHGIQGSGMKKIVIRNCDITWIGGGPVNPERGLDSRAGNGIELYGNAEDVLIERCRIGEIFGCGIALVGTSNHQKKNIVLLGNTVWNCDSSVGAFPETDIESLLVKENLFVGAGRGWAGKQGSRPGRRHLLLEKISENSKGIVLENNRFSDAAGPLLIFGCKAEEASGRIARCDANVFWQPNDEEIVSFSDKKFTATRFEEYRQTTGLDATSEIKEERFSPPTL